MRPITKFIRVTILVQRASRYRDSSCFELEVPSSALLWNVLHEFAITNIQIMSDYYSIDEHMLQPLVMVLQNGLYARPNSDIELVDGDVISIFKAYAGG